MFSKNQIWGCALQSFSEIIRSQNHKYFLEVKASYSVGCAKPHTISCKRIETTNTSSKLEKIKTFTSFSVLSLAGNNTLSKRAACSFELSSYSPWSFRYNSKF